MSALNSVPFQTVSRFTFAAVSLALIAGPNLGCDSANQPDKSLRADVAAIRGLHGDANDIGSLDATAPPPDLNDYRKPVYRTTSAH